MIHRTRNDSPAELVEQNRQWVERLDADPLLDYKREWVNFRGTRAYNATREALNGMYNQKCCFCEINTGDRIVEHFEPKSLNNRRMFEYNNLHLICSGCNSKKGKKDVAEVIDPSIDDPSEHLVFKTEEVDFFDGKGRVTIACVDLNRLELKNLRQAMLNELKYNVDSIVGHLSEVLTIGSLQRHLADLQFIRENSFSESSPFSKLLLDNFGQNIDDLEAIINDRIQEIENVA